MTLRRRHVRFDIVDVDACGIALDTRRSQTMASALTDLDRRLTFGPALRVQRVAEAALVLAALFFRDVRFAEAALASVVLQALSPRLALVGLVVAFTRPAPSKRVLGDLYFDLEGSRGACIVSALGMAAAIALIERGTPTLQIAGFVLLTPAAASFLMAPTLGFCAGCFIFVVARDRVRRSFSRLFSRGAGGFRDHRDIALDR